MGSCKIDLHSIGKSKVAANPQLVTELKKVSRHGIRGGHKIVERDLKRKQGDAARYGSTPRPIAKLMIVPANQCDAQGSGSGDQSGGRRTWAIHLKKRGH